jgi:hypothetical protein
MTMHDDIEIQLRQALEIGLPEEGARVLDARVAGAMSQPIAARGWRFGGSPALLRAVALAAALALVTGTVAATLTLLERIASESTPGVQAAWDGAELVALEETSAGVTITLERAYADLNQVAVFFTVEGLDTVTSDSGETAPLDWIAELRDPAGRSAEEWAVIRGGTEGYELEVSANVHTWEGAVTPMAGTWELTFTSVGYNTGGFVDGACDAESTDPACASPPPNAMVEGSWRFEFDLPQPAGSLVSTELTATADEAIVTISELRISPTMISASMALRLDDETVTSWGTANDALVSIEGPGGTYPANTTFHVTQDPDDQGPSGDVNLFMTTEGSDEATGPWSITIPQLWYATDHGGPDTGTVVDAPVTFTVDVP